eukprot:GEMP01026520.1.p1 GENE.GEMP01026520.1~~GEMP01026520.1.p1  ORF type:complete len:373 (+),score=61.98 GEMP01026520.1:446-1564(+)
MCCAFFGCQAGSLGVVYFKSEDEFPEVFDFIAKTVRTLGITLDMYTCSWRDGMKAAHEKYSEGGVIAFVMGTRFRDPDCKGEDGLSQILPSSTWTVPFLRVQPIVRWGYQDVWKFLRQFSLPYCELYDHGYTSLGTRYNTTQNSSLQLLDGSYEPAYCLSDPSLERSGRQTAEPKEPSTSEPLRAGVLIYSDEILGGNVQDTMSSGIINLLKEKNVALKKIMVVSERLAEEIREMSAHLDIVLAISNRGSTTDLILAEGTADAFHLSVCEVNLGSVRASMNAKTTMVPAPCEFLAEPDENYPVVKVENVYLFPGTHTTMNAKLDSILAYHRYKPESTETPESCDSKNTDSDPPVHSRDVVQTRANVYLLQVK